jgi:hypothetical protein
VPAWGGRQAGLLQCVCVQSYRESVHESERASEKEREAETHAQGQRETETQYLSVQKHKDQKRAGACARASERRDAKNKRISCSTPAPLNRPLTPSTRTIDTSP